MKRIVKPLLIIGFIFLILIFNNCRKFKQPTEPAATDTPNETTTEAAIQTQTAAMATRTGTLTPTKSPNINLSPTVSATISATASITPVVSPTSTSTISQTLTQTVSGTITPTPTFTATFTITPAPIVYAAGVDVGGACYWVGNSETAIAGMGAANSIYVSGGTVYTAGTGGSGPAYAAGTTVTALVALPGAANSIYVSNNNVYVAGYTISGSVNQACYWVNGGSAINLPGDGVDSCVATGISVQNGTIYTSGYWYNGTSYTACYWTGATRTDLPGDGTYSAQAYAIFVDSTGTVYTAGYYQTLEYMGSSQVAAYLPCYWTGNLRSSLSLPLNAGNVYPDTGYAYSIYVSGGTVYASGDYTDYTYSSPPQFPCYWSGGALNVANMGNGEAASIYVLNGTIYTAGYVANINILDQIVYTPMLFTPGNAALPYQNSATYYGSAKAYAVFAQ